MGFSRPRELIWDGIILNLIFGTIAVIVLILGWGLLYGILTCDTKRCVSRSHEQWRTIRRRGFFVYLLRLWSLTSLDSVLASFLRVFGQ